MFRSIAAVLLALVIPAAASAADPTASPGHMMSHGAMKGHTAMKGGAMKGHTAMKGGAMKGGSMKGGAMTGDAMHGAMKSPAPKAT